jgi:hypothetical protein
MPRETIEVTLPVYRPLAHRHKWLMQILVSYAESNPEFKCFPSLRTIATAAGDKLAATAKCLAEMESLGYFTRRRGTKAERFAFVYWLAKRFQPARRQESIPVDSQLRAYKPPNNPRNPQFCAQPESTPVDKRRSQIREDSRKYLGDDGRCAPVAAAPPSEDDQRYVAARVAEAAAALSGNRVRDPEAYAAAQAETRFKQWLRGAAGRNDGGLYRFVCDNFPPGPQLFALQEAISVALQAGSREATPPLVLRELNKLDALYRAKLKTDGVARAADKRQQRRDSFARMRRTWADYGPAVAAA